MHFFLLKDVWHVHSQRIVSFDQNFSISLFKQNLIKIISIEKVKKIYFVIIMLRSYWKVGKQNNCLINNHPHHIVILREFFENIPLKYCNITRIFMKLLERFLKNCRKFAMFGQNIINGMLLQYEYFITVLP